jgi:hypothetical protein
MHSTKGFASLSPVQKKYVSAKGGRVKTKKGLGAMPPDKAAAIQKLGGLKRQEILRQQKENDGKDFIPNRHDS